MLPPRPRSRGSRRQHFGRSNGVAAASYSLDLYDWSASNQAIDDNNYRDHQKNMDEAATHVYNEESK
jgi:hypothetical protein